MLDDHPDTDDATFNRIQDMILDCVADTVKDGTKNKYAQGYLDSILTVCSRSQRKILIETCKGLHSPLSLACEIGNEDALRFFLDCCDLDLNIRSGECILMSAIMKGHYEIVRLLIQCGKKVTCRTDLFSCPLVVACGGYPIDFEGRNITKEPEHTGFPKQEMTYDFSFYKKFTKRYEGHCGNFAMAKLLIENGALNDIEPVALFKCFKLCIDQRNWDIMKLLTENVDNVDVRNLEECSVLGYAVQKLEQKAVQILMRKGADINDTRMIMNSRLSELNDSGYSDGDSDNEESRGTNKGNSLPKSYIELLKHCTCSNASSFTESNTNPSSKKKIKKSAKVSQKKSASSETQVRKTRSSSVIKNSSSRSLPEKSNPKALKRNTISQPLTKQKSGKKSNRKNGKENKVSRRTQPKENLQQNKFTKVQLSKKGDDNEDKDDDNEDDDNNDVEFYRKKVFVHPVVYCAAKGDLILLYYFINSEKVPFHEKMNALEVFGARRAMSMNSSGAFGVWETTLLHRHHYPVKEGEISQKDNIAEPRDFMFGITEAKTIEELDQHCPNNTRTALIMAVAVYERTIGYYPELTLEPVKKLAEYYFINKKYEPYLNLWANMLKDLFESCEDDSPEHKECIRILKYVTLLIGKSFYVGSYKGSFKMMLPLCESFFHAGLHVGKEDEMIAGYDTLVLDLYLLALDILRKCERTEEETIDYCAFMESVLWSNPRSEDMQTLLHKAVKANSILDVDLALVDVEDMTADLFGIPDCGNPDMVAVLIHFGADINARDGEGNTPFHTLFDFWESSCEEILLKETYDIFDELNAHPDYVNNDGETPISLAKKCYINLNSASWQSLQCLSAHVIGKERIPYKEYLPIELQKFVQQHSRPEKDENDKGEVD